MVKHQEYISKNTIQQTAVVTWTFGTDKSVPYEHAGRRPIHPTFVNPLKANIADESRYTHCTISNIQKALRNMSAILLDTVPVTKMAPNTFKLQRNVRKTTVFVVKTVVFGAASQI